MTLTTASPVQPAPSLHGGAGLRDRSGPAGALPPRASRPHLLGRDPSAGLDSSSRMTGDSLHLTGKSTGCPHAFPAPVIDTAAPQSGR